MKKVLIVEDDRDNLFVLTWCIRGMGVEVATKSKIIPLNEIIEISPDLVMLDHWINNEHGGDLCYQIKSNPLTSGIPVVLISAVVDLNNIAKDCLADDYLEKPFDISDVENLLKKYLSLDFA